MCYFFFQWLLILFDIITIYFFSDFATVVGFYAVSIPFFQNNHPVLSGTANHRFKSYYTYGRMLVKLAEAVGRLVLAGRELTRLAGFTARVTEIKKVLDDLNAGKYERTMISDYKNNAIGYPGGGKIVPRDNIIRFDQVPLVTPNGDVLIKELSFEVKSGVNVLVCGPNGCGKSSMFRILGEVRARYLYCVIYCSFLSHVLIYLRIYFVIVSIKSCCNFLSLIQRMID